MLTKIELVGSRVFHSLGGTLFVSRPCRSAFDQTLDADQDRVSGSLGFSTRWGGLFFSLVLAGPHSTRLLMLTKIGSVGVSGFPPVGEDSFFLLSLWGRIRA